MDDASVHRSVRFAGRLLVPVGFAVPVGLSVPVLLLVPVLLSVPAFLPGVSKAQALDEVIWEWNRAWAPGVVPSSGLRVAVDPSAKAFGEGPRRGRAAIACPQAMGAEGGRLVWEFDVPAEEAVATCLRFELVLDRVEGRFAVEVEAGGSGGPLAAVESWSIEAPAVYRAVIPRATLLAAPHAGSRGEIAIRAVPDSATTGGRARFRWIAAGLYRHLPKPPPLSDEGLLDDSQWRAAMYFFEQALPGGLVLDRLGSEWASIGATGFGATAMSLLAARHGSTPRWTVTPAEAKARVESLLDRVLAIQSRQKDEERIWGKGGLPFHFTDAEGRRGGGSEVSTADGALLLAGLLQAGEYFGGRLREKALAVFRGVDFKAFLSRDTRRYSHGWTPEGGILRAEWDRPTDELLLIAILSVAADPRDPDRLAACYSYPRVTEVYRGIPVVRSYFGSLFTYTFAHFWVPFEELGRDRPHALGNAPGGAVPAVDWWENSRRAVEANRLYHEEWSARRPGLGPEAWGASACYRADSLAYFGPNGARPSEAEAAFDGTLPPHGAIMSLFLAREDPSKPLGANPAFRALRGYYETRFSTLWSSYGPRSSFDLEGRASPVVVGIEKGPEALGIECYRSGMPSRTFARVEAIAAALAVLFEGR